MAEASNGFPISHCVDKMQMNADPCQLSLQNIVPLNQQPFHVNEYQIDRLRNQASPYPQNETGHPIIRVSNFNIIEWSITSYL